MAELPPDLEPEELRAFERARKRRRNTLIRAGIGLGAALVVRVIFWFQQPPEPHVVVVTPKVGFVKTTLPFRLEGAPSVDAGPLDGGPG